MTEGSSNPFVSAFTENVPLKLLSLALSVLLFSIVHSDQDGQRSIFVDVVALLPPPGSQKMLISDIPHQVKVTLRGSNSFANRGVVAVIGLCLIWGPVPAAAETLHVPGGMPTIEAVTDAPVDGDKVEVHVLTCDGDEGADAVLDGFAITGGSADFGGGLYNRASFATEDSMTR